MKVAFVYPPTCDPAEPYPSVPILTICLSCHGVGVFPVNANAEAYGKL